MPKSATVQVSATEFPQFRRLIEFVECVDSLARVNADEELADLVCELRNDLLWLRPGPPQ